MEQQIPIFIPMDEIVEFPAPLHDPILEGRVDLVAKGGVLHGFRCEDIVGKYSSDNNGIGKGHTQTLICTCRSRESYFNYMVRTMQIKQACYIVLLPQANATYIVFGNNGPEIEFVTSSVEDYLRAIVLECAYMPTAVPYYVGKVNVTECDVPQLMEHLYGKKE